MIVWMLIATLMTGERAAFVVAHETCVTAPIDLMLGKRVEVVTLDGEVHEIASAVCVRVRPRELSS